MRGFILACTDKSEQECLENLVFATNRIYGNKVLAIRKGDLVFLYNIDREKLFGTFVAESDGYFDKESNLFDGKYPYQVKVKLLGNKLSVLEDSKRLFNKLGISWRDILSEKGCKLLKNILEGKKDLNDLKASKGSKQLVDSDYIPPMFSTTLWDYPKQSYGDTPKGNNKYPGVTPAFIIYNMIHRYTEPGDIVLDPMAGSGTTIDVCKAEKRIPIAFDIKPTRPDITQADARNLPLDDESIDMVFIDSPYGDNIKYNDHPENIGHISAIDERFYDELEQVMKECYRVMKKGKYLGWLIGDQWAKGVFVPVGFKIYERLTKYFTPVDIIAVVRRNQSSNTPFWQSRALKHNFYLRGFKYLIIVKKENKSDQSSKRINIKWNYYER